ncbi:short-chain dehydrogenase [Fomitopsis serialis]|uniref:short-chain dehydrogenase n=1 Tax=Fomitopsis serialis TaxID=139415 RepID=UPI002008E884|nr:short-chain dehydrogenase [Neoantrodia serialis]KAH9924735.1 short-chain dehydrogenase [Neoantrodia serialis]
MSQSLRLDKLFGVHGRIALVTGGGTGLGWMIAEGLAVNGARVYITGRRKDVLEQSAAKFTQKHKGDGSVIPLVMDVTDKASILAAHEVIKAKEGKLHILVNNAGIAGPFASFFNDMSAPQHKDAETLGRALFDSASFDDWADVYTVNTFSVYFVTTAFLGLLARGSQDVPGYTSSVINLGSISGNTSWRRTSPFAYNSTKGAVTHLTKMLATELALKKIPVRVCSVAPGVFPSEMTGGEVTPDLVEKHANGIVPVPMGRAGTAQEMAGTVIYLVSPAGCYTTGEEILTDGGYIAVNPSMR